MKVRAELRFSEIYASPDINEHEWYELYNDSDEAVDLSNFSLSREKAGRIYRPELLTATAATVAAHSYFVAVPEYSLGLKIEPTIKGGTATLNDVWKYEVIKDRFTDYGFPSTVTLNGSGKVTINNAGVAVVKITLIDKTGAYNNVERRQIGRASCRERV